MYVIINIFLFIAGDLMNEDEVLEWLRKNRFRQPELNIFMYALIALSIAFVLYTAFLLQCFKPAPPAPAPHPKQQWHLHRLFNIVSFESWLRETMSRTVPLLIPFCLWWYIIWRSKCCDVTFIDKVFFQTYLFVTKNI